MYFNSLFPPFSIFGFSSCYLFECRAGPRIFIGKLTKETTEADVKEYFMRFGYVMDVYLPKAKDNKMVGGKVCVCVCVKGGGGGETVCVMDVYLPRAMDNKMVGGKVCVYGGLDMVRLLYPVVDRSCVEWRGI